MKAPRWTRKPPQGEYIVAFLQDPKGVSDFVAENNNELNRGKSARLHPQIGVRMIDKELGPLWVVLGEGTWTEEHLKAKGVVWWSSPIDIPMIQVLFPKVSNGKVFDSLSQDLSVGSDSPPRKSSPRQEG